MKFLPALPLLSAVLVAGTLPAASPASLQERQAQRVVRAQEALMAQRAALGLDSETAFRLRKAFTDGLGQTHARFQQTYKGLRVFGGEAISHLDAEGRILPLTDGLSRDIRLNTTPSIERAEALGIAHRELAPKGPYEREPSAELVVFPVETEVVRPGRAGRDLDATAFERQVVRHALAWHIRAELMNGKEETRSQDYLIDAHTGAILKTWDSLQTGAATGTGHSQWYGAVSLNTNNTGASAYEMRDLTRGGTAVVGAVGNATTNLDHKTSGTGAIYTDPDNDWGDGGMYGSGTATSTTSATGQTAAVDAHRGLQATWDFYGNVFGRNGIDGLGTATYNRMHYSKSYDNAFWQDSCFCMTYGDGDPVNGGSVGEADLDTAGHEMSHGVCANEANLTYSGESGGLNESNSDIFGTMVEFYTLGGGAGSTIPDSGSIVVGGNTISANYKMFENSWGHPAPNDALRWMYRPDLDGASPNFWYSGLGSLDVHYSSGANNRFFYFLAKGATTSGDTSTAVNTTGSTGVANPNFLPNGMNGIGNDSAARIWYRALTTYLTASSNYAAARTAALSAATDLFGANSFEYYSVQNAYHGVNVGAAASATAVKASITLPASDVTINSGSSVSFTGTAVDTIPSVALSYAWTFGDGANATGASTSHAFTNSTGSDIVYTVTFAATDANSASASATRTITVHPAGDTTAPTASGSESGARGTITLSATASDDVAVTSVEFYVDGALKGTLTGLPYDLALDSTTLADGSHALVIKAHDAAGNIGTSASLPFNTDNTKPSGTVYETGTTGTITLGASASDNIAMDRVGFFIDGGYVAAATSSPYTLTFDSTWLRNGSHTLQGTVKDLAGNIYNTPIVTFSTSNAATDTTAPTGVAASEVGTSGTIELHCAASDDNAVAKISYYIDGIWIGTSSKSPFTVYFNSAWIKNGSHTLTAFAMDFAGNTTQSAPVTFSTSNGTYDTTPPQNIVPSVTGTSGTITLHVTATDDSGLSRASFYLDNNFVVTDLSQPFTVPFNSTWLKNGSHSLKVYVLDFAGNVAASSVLPFSTSNGTTDTTAPTGVVPSVSGTSGTLTFSSTASDNAAVARIGYFVDGVSVGTGSMKPFSITYNSALLSNGTHSLVSRAVDFANNYTDSAPVSFSVSN